MEARLKPVKITSLRYKAHSTTSSSFPLSIQEVRLLLSTERGEAIDGDGGGRANNDGNEERERERERGTGGGGCWKMDEAEGDGRRRRESLLQ